MPLVDRKYRYPGVKPFSSKQSRIFFGRDNDIEKMGRFLEIENLVVLHGKSGLGKTSLINAGVLPYLDNRKAELHYEPNYVRFGSFHPKNPEHPLNIFQQILPPSPSFLDQVPVKRVSMWQIFKSREWTAASPKPKQILIFDQFEELFTYPEEFIWDFGRQLSDLYNKNMPTEFRKALRRERAINKELDAEIKESGAGDWLESPLEIKILIAIRSDKLHHLDSLKPFVPEILQTSYELQPLDRDQAKSAIIKPAVQEGKFDSDPFEYEEDAIKKILDFLTENSSKRVEAFQLQIICQHLERKIIDGKVQKILPEDVDDDLGGILKSYYDVQIRKLDNKKERQLARTLIEDELILEKENRRVSLDAGQLMSKYPAITEDLLAKLVDTRIIRRQRNSVGGYSYELSHDTLIEPILRSKEERMQVDRIKKAKEKEEAERRELEQQFKTERVEAKKKRRQIIGYALFFILTIAAISTWRFTDVLDSLRKNKKIVHTVDSLNNNLEDTKDYYLWVIAKYDSADYDSIIDHNYVLWSKNKTLKNRLIKDSILLENKIAENDTLEETLKTVLLEKNNEINNLREEVLSLKKSIESGGSGPTTPSVSPPDAQEDMTEFLRMQLTQVTTDRDNLTKKYLDMKNKYEKLQISLDHLETVSEKQKLDIETYLARINKLEKVLKSNGYRLEHAQQQIRFDEDISNKKPLEQLIQKQQEKKGK